ncbi:MAG: OB-fold domain-containing protein [Acidobacteriia bacterium]|nr:OB-fold domain-containing protein [Terriglobia bacterium]
MRTGTIYTETVIYSAPEAFTKDVPYQTAIVSLDGGGRVTGRILGDRVAIDDRVTEVAVAQSEASSNMTGVPFFRKA